MSQNIWVLAPLWRGCVSAQTFELLALGRELADQLGEKLHAVAWGHESQEQLQDLGAADKVLYLEHPHLANATPDVCGTALADLAHSMKPRCILIPAANETWELLGELPGRLGAPFLNFCTDVRTTNGGLEARCLLYGGKIEATALLPATPALFGVLPGARSSPATSSDKAPEVQLIVPSLPVESRLRLCRYVDPEVGEVDITQKEVLISVGRGIESDANVEIAEELAEALGGAVCGSRPVIDQGWLPLSRQVGKSGAQVQPRLYVAAGVSGAPEHVEGMKSSELIIAINTDPEAPIFNVAHYGVVGDAVETMEALVESLGATAGG